MRVHTAGFLATLVLVVLMVSASPAGAATTTASLQWAGDDSGEALMLPSAESYCGAPSDLLEQLLCRVF